MKHASPERGDPLADDTSSIYRPRPIKRARRTKDDIRELKDALREIMQPAQPVTVRQVFYMAVSAGIVEKTEKAYKNTVGRLLTEMRRDGELPFSWIADNTRWMRKPKTYDDLEDLLNETAALYRRNLWRQQGRYVEIWLEKDALSGVLYPATAQWDVPLMVTRGYASLTFLYEAAEYMKAQEKEVHIYYFGDHDPSGRDIPRQVEEDLRALAPGTEMYFSRVAVEEWQIAAWNLPTRPTKEADSRSIHFKGESVEVDAIPPDRLRQLVRDCIEQHIDDAALQVTQVAEQHERRLLNILNPSNLAWLGAEYGIHADDLDEDDEDDET
jgi:hypothetical protein